VFFSEVGNVLSKGLRHVVAPPSAAWHHTVRPGVRARACKTPKRYGGVCGGSTGRWRACALPPELPPARSMLSALLAASHTPCLQRRPARRAQPLLQGYLHDTASPYAHRVHFTIYTIQDTSRKLGAWRDRGAFLCGVCVCGGGLSPGLCMACVCVCLAANVLQSLRWSNMTPDPV
jgi:hypothetical protein